MQYKIIGKNVDNIPWEEKPLDNDKPMWRFSLNPVIKRNPFNGVARIFNSAVIPYKNEFCGIFRGDKLDGMPDLFFGRSKNGIEWRFNEKPIEFKNEKDKEVKSKYKYDPRLTEIEGEYVIVWCTDFYGASLGIGITKDFIKYKNISNPFLPFNRNGVLFPKKINERYLMLTRPSDSGHTPFGDIFLSESYDLMYWGNNKHIMSRTDKWWENVKIGSGTVPIETNIGWLMFYHGVTSTCNGYVYSIGGVILDRNEPSKIIARSKYYLLTPEAEYEIQGFVPNVIFPCATIADAKTGRIVLYYGGADTYTAIAFTEVNTVVDYILKNNEI